MPGSLRGSIVVLPPRREYCTSPNKCTAPVFPDYGPAICRGFLDSYRTPVLLALRAAQRLTEVPPPVIAKAEELGRDAGKAAATWVFDGSTTEDAYQRVLRGIDDGDPAVLDAIEPPAIGPAADYTQDDLRHAIRLG